MWWMMPGTVKREKTLGTRLKTTGAAVNAAKDFSSKCTQD